MNKTFQDRTEVKKIKFSCSHCHASLRVPAHLAGVSGPCPKCGKVITAPLESEEGQEVTSSHAGSGTSSQVAQTRAVHGNGSSGGVAVASPKTAVDSRPEAAQSPPAVAHAPEAKSHETMEDQPMERFRPPLPDVAMSPPRYEKPPAPMLPPDIAASVEPEVEAAPPYEAEGELPHPVVAPEPLFPEPEEPLLEGEEQIVSSEIAEPTASEVRHPEEESPPMVQDFAVPKTQPIRIKRNPTPLPPRREEYEAQPDGIPRLDTSLGESEGLSVGAPGQHVPEQAKGPIKLNLPPLGTTVEATSPEDFTRPPQAPVSQEPDYVEPSEPESSLVYEVGDEQVTPEPADRYVSIPLSDEVESDPYQEFSHEEPSPPMLEEEMPAVHAPVPPPLDDEEEPMVLETEPELASSVETNYPEDSIPSYDPHSEVSEMEGQPQAVPDSTTYQEVQAELPPMDSTGQDNPEEAVSSVPMPQFSLQTDSVKSRIGKVNKTKTEPVQTEPDSQHLPETRFSQGDQTEQHYSTTGEGSIGALFGSGVSDTRLSPSEQKGGPGPLGAPSGGSSTPAVSEERQKKASQKLPPAPAADELDELLGKTSNSGSKSRLGLYFLLVGLGVVVIAAIMVFVVGEALLGGFSLTDNGSEEKPEKLLPYENPPVASGEEEKTKEPGAEEAVKAPEKIDVTAAQPAQRGVTEEEEKSTTTLPHNYEQKVLIQDSSGQKEEDGSKSAGSSQVGQNEQLVMPAPGAGTEDRETPIADLLQSAGGDLVTSVDSTDSSLEDFDRQVDNVLKGSGDFLSGQGSNVGGAGSLLESISTEVKKNTAAPAEPQANQPAEKKEEAVPAPKEGSPAVFPAPGEGESNLARVRDVLEAFLKAPTWEDRVAYVFQGASLRPAMEEYYKQVEYATVDRFSLQLFQIDESSTSGNPYWVYFLSTSDDEQGYPVIVRIEDGNLKVDWEVFSEFHDRHFAKFLSGGISSPHTFRVVLEQKSDYFGADRQDFSDKDKYLIFEVTPPYGGLGEFSEYAFVEKDSELADQLNSNIGLSEEPLAVMVTLDWKQFAHGNRHLVVTKYITEGWLN